MSYKIKNAKLFNEKGLYYIDVTYRHEDERVIEEINIPKLEIPLLPFGRVDISCDYYDCAISPSARPLIIGHAFNIGSDRLHMREKNGVAYTVKIIEEKAQEMTIDEIEKKLGYKVKIVNEKVKNGK